MSIRLSGLRPHSLVAISASTEASPGKLWRSSAVFRADGAGRVIVVRDRSLGGTYRGRYRMGLFWSMRLVGSKLPFDEQNMFVGLAKVTTVRFVATENDRTVAAATMIRRTATPDVTERETSRGRRLRGLLLRKAERDAGPRGGHARRLGGRPPM